VINLYDIAWGIGVGAAAPVWLLKSTARAKVRRAFAERMGDVPTRTGDGPAIMLHAVSLGEMNATRAMVSELLGSSDDLHIIVSTTTQTGHARGEELYGQNPRVTLVHYPLDFSSAITRFLDRLKPTVVVLMELEVWPNFMLHCHRRAIPVLLVNGRLTAGSFKNYRRGSLLVRRMFGRLTAVCAQDQQYADRFIALGAPADRVSVTGTMKFDTAQIADRIPGDSELADALKLSTDQPIWVCGSTGPGEEQFLLDVYGQLLQSHNTLRLVIVPRKPERFDEVAAMITAAGFKLVRRSAPSLDAVEDAVILGDTMGELRKFYSLARVVFVGRTLLDLGSRQHGSDMIEPAALAKPVAVGPFTGNFAEVMQKFRDANAMVEVTTSAELADQMNRFLSDPTSASEMGHRAQAVVQHERGATHRHVEIILKTLDDVQKRCSAK
jgi:3-deoxy-D-manno-octulosonic-acid transferase